MDIKVLEAQQWLNQTYGGDPRYGAPLELDGKPGTAVCEALVLGLQIELGMSNATGYFGEQTASEFTRQVGTLQMPMGIGEGLLPSNFVKLLQHGLYCKGYECHGVTGFYSQGTYDAICNLQHDAGIAQTGTVNAMVMKAVLNTDAFVLIYRGSEDVRYIQQWLNGNYNGYFGLQACDGIYGRGTNEALIYALQDELGLGNVANGNFGPTTTSTCSSKGQIAQGSTKTVLVRLLKFALYCNGYDPGIYNTNFDNSTVYAVEAFQSFMGLPSTGRGDLNTWMSLLTSKGNPDRSAKACDCATQLTEAKIRALKSAGYETVGRYLTGRSYSGPKNLIRMEAVCILANGMNFFPILQQGGDSLEYFNYDQGIEDAKDAYNAAKAIGLPEGTIIYFAVDYDMMDHQVDSHVFPYMNAVDSAFRSYYGSYYRVGIYGSRNVCSRVGLKGYSVSSFVGDMSTGYSGNFGYNMPADWAYDQFHEYTFTGSSDGSFGLDKDAKSSRAKPVTRLDAVEEEPTPITLPLSDDIKSAYPNGGRMYYYVNRSAKTFDVYMGVVNGQFTKKIAEIKPNDMYASTDMSTGYAAGWKNKIVLVKGLDGKMVAGYVKCILYAGSGVNEFADQGYFERFNSNGTALITNSPVSISGYSGNYYVFTAKKQIDVYDKTGEKVSTVASGTQLAIFNDGDASIAGSNKPHLMCIDLKKTNTGWGGLVGSTYGFIDMQIENGVSPDTRAIW